MPLLKGKKHQAHNFHEFRHGKTFKKTARKYGLGKARKQMQAVVLGQSRKKSRPRLR